METIYTNALQSNGISTHWGVTNCSDFCETIEHVSFQSRNYWSHMFWMVAHVFEFRIRMLCRRLLHIKAVHARKARVKIQIRPQMKKVVPFVQCVDVDSTQFIPEFIHCIIMAIPWYELNFIPNTIKFAESALFFQYSLKSLDRNAVQDDPQRSPGLSIGSICHPHVPLVRENQFCHRIFLFQELL